MRFIHFFNAQTLILCASIKLCRNGYTVSRGVPVFSLAMTEYFVRKEINEEYCKDE